MKSPEIRTDDGVKLRCVVYSYSTTSGLSDISDQATLNLGELPPEPGDSVLWFGENTNDDYEAVSIIDGRDAPLPGQFYIAFEFYWDGTLGPGSSVQQAVLRNGFSASSNNWRVDMINMGDTTPTVRIVFSPGPVVVTASNTFTANQWNTVEINHEEGVTSITLNGTETSEATDGFGGTASHGTYAIGHLSSNQSTGFYFRNLQIIEDYGQFELNFPCNDGEGLVWTETGGNNGTISDVLMHRDDPAPPEAAEETI